MRMPKNIEVITRGQPLACVRRAAFPGAAVASGIPRWALAIGVAIALSACSHKKAPPPPPPAVVKVVTLRSQPVSLTTDLPGRTVAFKVAEIRPQVTGVIQKRMFIEGSDVKEGQQLYQ